MKKRLIDADATLQIIDNYAKTVDGEHKEVIKAIRDIVEVISPTVDAVEVVHGKWIVDTNWEYDYRCSICAELACEGGYGNFDSLTTYCPHCGARMDGKVSE